MTNQIITRGARFLMAGALLFVPAVGFAADGVPRDTLAYFNGPCPADWEQAPDEARGRIVIPTLDGGQTETTLGAPITSDTPTHLHKARGTIVVPDESFILAGGCCNENLGKAGTKVISGTSARADNHLPFVNLNLCKKTAPRQRVDLPRDIMFYNASRCPALTTEEYQRAEGRHVFGLTALGNPGAKSGGTDLEPREVRKHSHKVAGAITFESHSIVGGAGCCASGYARSGKVRFSMDTLTGPSRAGEEITAHTHAPYYTANLCVTK